MNKIHTNINVFLVAFLALLGIILSSALFNASELQNKVMASGSDVTSQLAMTDASADELIDNGEEVTFTITLKNQSNEATTVEVFDKQITDLSDYFVIDTTNIVTLAGTDGVTTDAGDDIRITHLSLVGLNVTIPANGELTLSFSLMAQNDIVEKYASETVCNDAYTIDAEQTREDFSGCLMVAKPAEPAITSEKIITNQTGSETELLENGETVTYTINLSNQSNYATTINVKDDVLAQLTDYYLIDSTAFIRVEGTRGTIVLSKSLRIADLNYAGINIYLPTASEATISFEMKAKSDVQNSSENSEVCNVATVAPSDLEVQNPEACLTVAPKERAVITSEKLLTDESGNQSIENGETLTYQISLTNDSDYAATMLVKDAELVELAKYFEIDTTDLIVVDAETGALVISDKMGLATLIYDGIEVYIPANSKISLSFNVEAKSNIQNIYPNEIICNTATIAPIEDNVLLDNLEQSTEVCTTVSPIEPLNISFEKKVADANGNQAIENSEEITYTIVVENASANEVTIDIKDEITAQLGAYFDIDATDELVVTGTDGVVYDTNRARLTALIYDGLDVFLPANGQAEISFTLKAKESLETASAGQDICNIAEASSETGEIKTASACLPVYEAPADLITSEKTNIDADGDGLISNGEMLTYSITLSNEGNNASMIKVNDDVFTQLKDYFTVDLTKIVTATGATDGISLPRTLRISDLVYDGVEIYLPANANVTLTFDLKAKSDIETTYPGTEVCNVAVVTLRNAEKQNPEACIKIKETKPITAAIEKTVTDATDDNLLENNEDLTYIIRVENTSDYAGIVEVKDESLQELADYLEIDTTTVVEVTGTEGLSYNADRARVSALIYDGFDLELPAGGYAELKFTLKSQETIVDDFAGEEICNVAQVLPEESEPTLATACIEIKEPELPKIAATKTVVDANENELIENGEEITYTINVTNNSNKNTTINLLDDLTTQLGEYFIIDPLVETNIVGTENVIVLSESEKLENLISNGLEIYLPPSSEVDVTFKLTAKDNIQELAPGEEICNMANISTTISQNLEPSACLAISEITQTDITSEKKVIDASGDGVLENGEKLKYTIVVTNQADTKADMVISDDVFEQISDYFEIDATSAVGVTSNTKITTTPASDSIKIAHIDTGNVTVQLDGNASAELTFEVTAKSNIEDIYAGAKICNIATITPVKSTQEEIKPEACIEVREKEEPIVTAKKTVTDSDGNSVVSNGESVTYAVAVENTTTTATEVIVSDDLINQLANYFEIELSSKVTFVSDNGSEINEAELTLDQLINGGITVTLPANSTGTLSFDLVAKDDIEENYAEEKICNIATVTPISEQAELAPEACTEVSPLEAAPAEISIKKTAVDANKDNAVENLEEVVYTIKAENTGTTEAELRLQDTKIKELKKYYDIHESQQLVVNFTDGKITEEEGTSIDLSRLMNDGVKVLLKPGSEVEVTFKVEAVVDIQELYPNENICNSATAELIATSKGVESETCLLVSSVEEPIAEINSEKTSIDANHDGLIGNDEEVKYSITVNNTNEGNARVVITDEITKQLNEYFEINDKVIAQQLEVTGIDNQRWTLADLIAGNVVFELNSQKTATISFTLTAKSTIEENYSGATITNTAEVQELENDQLLKPAVSNKVKTKKTIIEEITDENTDETTTENTDEPEKPTVEICDTDTCDAEPTVTDSTKDKVLKSGEVTSLYVVIMILTLFVLILIRQKIKLKNQ